MVVEEVAAGNEMSLANMVLRFYEEAERERWPEDGDDGSDDEGRGAGDAAGSTAFWRERHSQLRAALAKTTSAESRIQVDTEEAVRQMCSAGGVCSCASRAPAGGCRSCALRFIAERLRDAGYDSAICRTKWSRSPDIPSGKHMYVDVVVPTRSGKAVRVVIEPSFRAEYRALVGALPEVFVGRAERLLGVIRVMCAAAKQSARESNMHMAPWRKHRYMEAKWLGTPERVAPGAGDGGMVAVGSPEKQQPRFRASLLTLDFGGRTAVKVM